MEIPSHNLKLLIQDIKKDDPEYNRLIRTYGPNSLAAQYFLESVIKEVSAWYRSNNDTIKELRDLNAANPPKNGRITAEYPYIFKRLIEIRCGRNASPQEIQRETTKWLKSHPEFWTDRAL